jgi:hypothetical protein
MASTSYCRRIWTLELFMAFNGRFFTAFGCGEPRLSTTPCRSNFERLNYRETSAWPALATKQRTALKPLPRFILSGNLVSQPRFACYLFNALLYRHTQSSYVEKSPPFEAVARRFRRRISRTTRGETSPFRSCIPKGSRPS